MTRSEIKISCVLDSRFLAYLAIFQDSSLGKVLDFMHSLGTVSTCAHDMRVYTYMYVVKEIDRRTISINNTNHIDIVCVCGVNVVAGHQS